MKVELQGHFNEVEPDLEVGSRESVESEPLQSWITERVEQAAPPWARSATLILSYVERSGPVPRAEAAWANERFFMIHFLCVFHKGYEGFIPLPEARPT